MAYTAALNHRTLESFNLQRINYVLRDVIRTPVATDLAATRLNVRRNVRFVYHRQKNIETDIDLSLIARSIANGG